MGRLRGFRYVPRNAREWDEWFASEDVETGLGNPSVDGYVLSSDTDGNRSWVPNGGAGGNLWTLNRPVTGFFTPTNDGDIVDRSVMQYRRNDFYAQWQDYTNLNLAAGGTFQINDSSDADSINMAHDGTDFSITGTNTTAINIVGVSTWVFPNNHAINYTEFDDTEVEMIAFASEEEDAFFADVVFQSTWSSGLVDESSHAEPITNYGVTVNTSGGPAGFPSSGYLEFRDSKDAINVGGATVAKGFYDFGASDGRTGKDSNLTIECWVRVNNLGSTLSIALMGTREFVGSSNGWMWGIGNVGEVDAVVMQTPGNFALGAGSDTGDISTGTWYHIAVVRKAGTNDVVYWIDGVNSNAASNPTQSESRSPDSGDYGLWFGLQSVQASGTVDATIKGQDLQFNPSATGASWDLGPVRITLNVIRYDRTVESSFTPPSSWATGSGAATGTFVLGDDVYATTIDGETITLSSPGLTSVSNTFNVVGAVDFDSTLQVDGAANFDGAVTATSTLNVTGATTLQSTLNVQGTADFDAAVNFDSTATFTNGATTAVLSNDGTDFSITGSGLTDLDLDGFTQVVLDSGTALALQDADNNEYDVLQLAGTVAGATDEYWGYVELMADFEGTDADTSYTEKSKNQLDCTFSGSAAIDDAQFKFGSTSINFPADGDYVSFPSVPGLGYGDEDFTIEFWVRFSGIDAANNIIFDQRVSNASARIVFYYDGAGNQLLIFRSGSNIITGSSKSIDTWYHFALARQNGSTRFFVDGTQEGSTAADSVTYGQDGVILGEDAQNLGGGTGFRGWIDDLRITKGIARYTTTFTAPTEFHPLYADTEDANWQNVVLRLPFDGADGATNAVDVSYQQNAMTFNGTAQLDTAQSQFGGSSLLLDGNSDYVSTPDNKAFSIGTKDFTLECWVRFNSVPTGSTNQTFMSHWDAQGVSQKQFIFQASGVNGDIRLIYTTNGSTNVNVAGGSWSPSADTWYHVACVREGGNISFFIDGTQSGSSTANSADFFDSNADFRIGVHEASGGLDSYFNGWIDDVRVTIGTGRYTGNFTAPAAAFPLAEQRGDPGFASLQFLADFQGADAATSYTEKSSNAAVATFVGNAQLDNANSIAGGSSLLLDGTGDYIQFPDSAVFEPDGGEDFYMDCWAYADTLDGSGIDSLISKRNTSGSATGYQLYISSGTPNFIAWGSGGATILNTSSSLGTVSTGEWVHYAVAYDDSTTTWSLYVDGDLAQTEVEDAANIVHNATPFNIGRDTSNSTRNWDGWIDMVRVYKGADAILHTVDFTPRKKYWNETQSSSPSAVGTDVQVGNTSNVLSLIGSSITVVDATVFSDTVRFDGLPTLNDVGLQFDTGIANPTHNEGLLFYDNTENALSYYNDEADVTVNIGQENLVRVRNASGALIPNGSVVRKSGATGNRANIVLAQADSETNADVLGMATHDIEDNSDGYVTTLGLVNGLDTSSFSAGATLYLSDSVAGEFTDTKPTAAGSFVVEIGSVAVSNVSVGNIKVYIHPPPTPSDLLSASQDATITGTYLFESDIEIDKDAAKLRLQGNTGNVDDAAFLEILEGDGDTWGTDVFGFRFKLDGSNNYLYIQTAAGATVNDRWYMDRGNGAIYHTGNNYSLQGSGGLFIYDLGGTDSAQFSHDGTDFNTDFVSTTDWNITGLERLRIDGNGTSNRLQIGDDGSGVSAVVGATANDDTGLDYKAYFAYDAYWDDVNDQWVANRTTLGRKYLIEMGYHNNSIDFKYFDGTVSSPWADTDWDLLMSVQGGNNDVRFFGSNGIRIYDDSGADYVKFAHDGTDLNTTFLGTTDWNIFDLSFVKLADGATFRINDATNADSADFSHDGTDFNTGFTNTTDWNITGVTDSIYADANRFRLTNSSPRLELDESDASADEGLWRILANSGQLSFDAINDAYTVATPFMIVDRTTTTVDNVDFVNGVDVRIRDAGQLFVYDSGDTDYVQIYHDGTDGRIDAVNATYLRLMNGGSTKVEVGASSVNVLDDISMSSQTTLKLGVYTDAQRPAAGTAGRIIFNSDDGNLNIDDGTNWILPDGTTT